MYIYQWLKEHKTFGQGNMLSGPCVSTTIPHFTRYANVRSVQTWRHRLGICMGYLYNLSAFFVAFL